MSELRGKGWRVLGYFIWMLGAGVVLDSEAVGLGSVMLLTGFILFGVGMLQAHRPVAEIREQFGVLPKSERAIEVGSVTPWQPGGISPFQYDYGQKAAADAGRPYDSYGATPA